MPTAARPASTEYAPYYDRYVQQVPDGDVVALLRAQLGETLALLRAVPEARADHRYAEGKWSVREVVGHVADAERVFAYRLLRIARGDRTPLPGFDENAWMSQAPFEGRTLASLVAELETVRAATLTLVESLDEVALAREGRASDNPVTARALAWIIAGHERHHVTILRERYGV